MGLETEPAVQSSSEDGAATVDESVCECPCAPSESDMAEPREVMNQQRSPLFSPTRLNVFAASVSLICVLHCIALPLLAALMPMIAQFAENELAHQILVLLALPLSLRVVWISRSVNSDKLFVSAVLFGLGMLLVGAFVEAWSAYETLLTVAGGTLLGSAHIWHWLRRCRSGAFMQWPGDAQES